MKIFRVIVTDLWKQIPNRLMILCNLGVKHIRRKNHSGDYHELLRFVDKYPRLSKITKKDISKIHR